MISIIINHDDYENMQSHRNEHLAREYQELFIATVKSGDLDTTKWLFKRASKDIDLNKQYPPHGYTALSHAILNGHSDIASYLISLDDLDINLPNTIDGTTPLHLAAYRYCVEFIKSQS